MPPKTCSNGQSEILNCFSAKSKTRAKTVVALSFAALCAGGLSGGGARAGFLEDLFGAFSGEQRATPSRDYGYPERRARRQASSLSYIQRQRRKAAHSPSDGMATAGPQASGLCYAARQRARFDAAGRHFARRHAARGRQRDDRERPARVPGRRRLSAQGERFPRAGRRARHSEIEARRAGRDRKSGEDADIERPSGKLRQRRQVDVPIAPDWRERLSIKSRRRSRRRHMARKCWEPKEGTDSQRAEATGSRSTPSRPERPTA